MSRGQKPDAARVVAIMRDGGKPDDLSRHDRAIWEGIQRYQKQLDDWHEKHPGVPFKTASRKAIEDVAALEIQDGLSFTQISERIGRTVKGIVHLTNKYPDFYRGRLEAEILQRRQALMAAVEGAQFQSIKKHIAMVPAADAVIERILNPEAMPLSDANAFAKLAAAKEVRKTVGADVTSVGAQMEVAKLGSVVRDLIGVVRSARGEGPPTIEGEARLLPEGDSEEDDEGDDVGMPGV